MKAQLIDGKLISAEIKAEAAEEAAALNIDNDEDGNVVGRF